MLAGRKAQFWRIIAGLALFAFSFGYVEAAVVAYLRSIYTPLRAHFYPGSSSELFPLLSFDQLRSLGSEHVARLNIELGRELATLVMLAGAALGATRRLREWVAAFVVCFGVWDVAFYAWLKVLLRWPASLLTWDILFLLPVPWVGPVLAPVLVSVAMIGCGVVVLWRERGDRPVEISATRWAFIVLGGALVFAAFIADFRNTAAGGNPNAFHWWLFGVGLVAGVAGFGSALSTARR